MSETNETTENTTAEAPAPEAAPAAAPAEAAPAASMEDEVKIGDNTVDLRELVEAGVHFGHQTRRWNPKMRRYIYGARSGIHIIDLDQTVQLFSKAYDFVAASVARGGHVLFVGTKRQAQDVIKHHAGRAKQYFITNRWLGGTLTNFRTIKQGLDRLRSLERMRDEGVYAQLPKKEVVMPREGARAPREVPRWTQGHGHAAERDVRGRPASQESIAVAEAIKLNIPVGGDHGHQLRPRQDRLRDPGQRRRDPLDHRHHPAHRRRLRRRHGSRRKNEDAVPRTRTPQSAPRGRGCALAEARRCRPFDNVAEHVLKD